jgi:hypothetical protein
MRVPKPWHHVRPGRPFYRMLKLQNYHPRPRAPGKAPWADVYRVVEAPWRADVSRRTAWGRRGWPEAPWRADVSQHVPGPPRAPPPPVGAPGGHPGGHSAPPTRSHPHDPAPARRTAILAATPSLAPLFIGGKNGGNPALARPPAGDACLLDYLNAS